MEAIPVNLTGVRATALFQLYLRWLDNAGRRPILDDQWAPGALPRLAYDFSPFYESHQARYPVAIATLTMDGWTAQFLAAHPTALAIDLGCGLDSRVYRVDPPAGHHWYGVDFDDVIALSRQLYPRRAQHTTIGTSVAEARWLELVPDDQPVAVIADNLFGLLSEDEVRHTLSRIIDHFPGGEVYFNIAPAVARPPPGFEALGVKPKWSLDDPADAGKLDSRLRFVTALNLADNPALRRTPLHYRVTQALSPASKNSGWTIKYAFLTHALVDELSILAVSLELLAIVGQRLSLK